MKKRLSVIPIIVLLCFVCHVEADTSICLNADWVMPEEVHPLWRDWMGSALIEVTLGGATTNGQRDTVKTTSIDYEAAHGSVELDFKGLPENMLWVVFASIKSQKITSPNGKESVIVLAPVAMTFHSGLDDEDYPYEYSFFLFLQIFEVE